MLPEHSFDIDWTKQHCGVIQATYEEFANLMPELAREVLFSFPQEVINYLWDVKVHMLMPGQYPCIPNWHYDFIPRVNGEKDFSLVDPSTPEMYLWVSGDPLTEFRNTHGSWLIEPETWVPFTQLDEHRGTVSKEFTWRGFIRATPLEIAPGRPEGVEALRRHCQVYLDAENFEW